MARTLIDAGAGDVDRSMGQPGSAPPRVGAHAPVAGGLAKAALPYIDATEAAAIQVYVGNPRGWALSSGRPGPG